MSRNKLQVAIRLMLASLVLAAITFTCLRLVKVNATTAAFLYLLVVLFTAAFWGLLESTFVSIGSVLLFNFYFLPPVGTLTIADPQNWVALLAFLATAVIASQLSDKVRKQTAQAIDRQREMEQLYSLSRAILLLESGPSIAQQLAAHVSRVFEAPAVALYEKSSGAVHRAGPDDIPAAEDMLREASTRGTEIRDSNNRLIVAAIRLGAEPIGSLALKVRYLSDSALNGLVNLVAIGIERARTQEEASRLEAARQSDELKSTLLDAIAHEFKTPLTSIKAASTTLLTGNRINSDEQRELITVVDEEADRLSTLVTEAIQMARLAAGRIRLFPAAVSVNDILSGAAHSIQRLPDDQVTFEADTALSPLNVDQELLQLALRQLIDNAVKYSPPGSPVRVSAGRNGNNVLFTVEDEGMGVPENERIRIFERFYRGSGVMHNLAGAGLGLAIAKDIVEAHGGSIWTEPAPVRGALFLISIPIKRAPNK